MPIIVIQVYILSQIFWQYIFFLQNYDYSTIKQQRLVDCEDWDKIQNKDR